MRNNHIRIALIGIASFVFFAQHVEAGRIITGVRSTNTTQIQQQINALQTQLNLLQEQVNSIPAGLQGPEGLPGEQGEAGTPGLNCWDINANTQCDQEEDINLDLVCDALDCQGPQGEQGPPGPEGSGASIVLDCYTSYFISADATSRTAVCNAGDILTGGGCFTDPEVPITRSFPNASDEWECSTATPVTLGAYVRCCNLAPDAD